MPPHPWDPAPPRGRGTGAPRRAADQHLAVAQVAPGRREPGIAAHGFLERLPCLGYPAQLKQDVPLMERRLGPRRIEASRLVEAVQRGLQLSLGLERFGLGELR